MSQEAFARSISVHKITIARWERGETSPDADALQKICEVFQINPTWLILGEGAMKRSEPIYTIKESRSPYGMTPSGEKGLDDLGVLIDGIRDIFEKLNLDMTKKENLLLFHLLVEFFVHHLRRPIDSTQDQ
jgi:transcriptional regulator with XRE-family HTH domain